MTEIPGDRTPAAVLRSARAVRQLACPIHDEVFGAPCIVARQVGR
jgi:hypothetical protein